MTTAQAQRPLAKSKNLEAIFPTEQATETKSLLFVKKLLAVAVSNITYLRNIFPENAFGDKCLEDLNLKILRDESACPGACQVIKWVKGLFDALDKKYLKSLVLGIYVDPNNPETVIESYTFKFSYDNDGSVDIYRNDKKISQAYTAEETKKATVKLLRTLIILTNTLAPLPSNVMMTMKLMYYDEVTPEDYEPPGFKASDDNSFAFQDEATNIAVGSVSTSFHTVKLRVRTSSTQFTVHDEPSATSLDKAEESGYISKDQTMDSVQEVACEEEIETSEVLPEKDLNKGQTEPEDAESTTANEDDFKVRCPCGCNEDDGLMIMCGICKFWQHGVCFCVTNEEKAPENHICDVCTKPGDSQIKPTDPELCEMTSIAVQATCLWRRALSISTEFKRIVAPEFARRLGIENTVAQGLINRLEKEGFITKSGRGKKLGKVVNKEKIESEGIPQYLRTPKIIREEHLVNTSMDTDEYITENPVIEQASIDKEMNVLNAATNKMSLESKRKARASPARACVTDEPIQAEVKPSRKRARSKKNDAEFDIDLSQDIPSKGRKKKASKVSKDVVV